MCKRCSDTGNALAWQWQPMNTQPPPPRSTQRTLHAEAHAAASCLLAEATMHICEQRSNSRGQNNSRHATVQVRALAAHTRPRHRAGMPALSTSSLGAAKTRAWPCKFVTSAEQCTHALCDQSNLHGCVR